MEAKDTVMLDSEMEKITSFQGKGLNLDWGCVKAVAEAQAEISFKAGQESGCYAEGWASGLREVVEWIKAHRFELEDNQYAQAIWDSELQAKLKEWRIDEKV